jgi:hypothetical protein
VVINIAIYNHWATVGGLPCMCYTFSLHV